MDETTYRTVNAGSANEQNGGDTAIIIAIVVAVLVVLGVGIGYWFITRRRREEPNFELTVEQKTYSAIPINGIKVDDSPE